jgi:hypothetical protein
VDSDTELFSHAYSQPEPDADSAPSAEPSAPE